VWHSHPVRRWVNPAVKLPRGEALFALLLAILFAGVLVTVHSIEPETNFGPISLYSLGSFGIVMRAGFVVLGLAFFSLVAGLRGNARPAALYRVDLIMLSIAGAGLVIVGAFNADAPGTVSTLSGLIHSSAANVWSICAIIGILLFAVAFRQDGGSLAIGRSSRNLGILALITYLGGFLGPEPVQPRLFFALVVLWISLVANWLRTGKLTNLAGLEHS
jgi:Protein of unknown function (DUF998)